jgi:hypothetical protein
MADKPLIKEAHKYLAKGQLDNIKEWKKLVKEYSDGNNYNSLDLYLKRAMRKRH